jgi:hypothetical protein
MQNAGAKAVITVDGMDEAKLPYLITWQQHT